MTLYMTDSEVDAYNDAQCGLETEAQDGYLHRSDPDAPGIGCRRAKKTVRAIDEVYLCEEVSRNRVAGFRSLSDASLQRILETNGMETRTRGSTRWTSHLRARRTRAIGRYLRIQESLQEAEDILFDGMSTWTRQLHGQTSAGMISKWVHYSLLTKIGPTEHGLICSSSPRWRVMTLPLTIFRL